MIPIRLNRFSEWPNSQQRAERAGHRHRQREHHRERLHPALELRREHHEDHEHAEPDRDAGLLEALRHLLRVARERDVHVRRQDLGADRERHARRLLHADPVEVRADRHAALAIVARDLRRRRAELGAHDVAQLHDAAVARAHVEPLDRLGVAAIAGLEPHPDVVAAAGLLEHADVQPADHDLHRLRERAPVDPERGGLRAVGDHAQLGLAELEAAVEVDEAAVRGEPLDHRVRPLRELLERQVAAQLDLHRALVRAAAHHLGRVEDPDLAAGNAAERRARVADQLLHGAIALAARNQRSEHHAAIRLHETLGPGVAHRREHPGHLGLGEEPLPRRARGTRASPPPTTRAPPRSGRRTAPRRPTGTARPRARARTPSATRERRRARSRSCGRGARASSRARAGSSTR